MKNMWCKESCGACEHVDRGYDDSSHEVFGISDRCPFTEILKKYKEINKRDFNLEFAVSMTGCRFFKEDQEYKQRIIKIVDSIKDKLVEE